MYEEFEEQKNTLMMIYGTTKDLPIDPVAVKGPTFEESIENAGKSVLKLKKEGFLSTIPDNSTPQSIYEEEYRRIMNEKKPKEKKNPFPPNWDFENDEIIVQWMNLQFVKNAIKEIKNAPFINANKRNEAIVRLKNLILGCLHQMKEDNLITRDKKQLFTANSLNYFSKQVEVIKKKVLTHALHKNAIDVSKLKQMEGMEVYFPNLFKNEEKQQENDDKKKGKNEKNINEETQRLEKRVQECIDTFSFLYKPCPKTTPVSPRNPIKPKKPIQKAASRIFRLKPNIMKPTVGRGGLHGGALISDLSKKTNLWKITDPMHKQRSGTFFDPLKSFTDITSTLEVPHEEEIDFSSFDIPDVLKVKEDHPKEKKQVTFFSTSKGLEDMRQNIAHVKTKSEKEEEKKREKEIEEVAINAYNKTTKSAMELIANFKIEDTGDSDTDKLKEIWEELGVSVNQKLDLLIKYTTNSDESVKLKESYGLWEQCRNFAKQYNECYIKMKDFIRFEYNGSLAHLSELNEIIKNYTMCEDSIKGIEKQLKEGYGDDFIINGERATDMIINRRINIRRIISDHKIPVVIPD